MKVYCDGGARGNPGPAASAIVVYSENDEILAKEARFLGHATNNVAEYEALIMALSWLSKNATSSAEILLDSELVKKQMTGEYRVKSPEMKKRFSEAKAIEQALRYQVIYKHTPRSGNLLADKLVNEALDDNS